MYTIGIDEAGRGALAGPISVGVVMIPKGFYPRLNSLPKLKDSKKLSARQRAAWFDYIKTDKRIIYATARVYPRTIERINISNSANLAASRAFERLIKNSGINLRNVNIFLDGGLYLGSKSHRGLGAKTIIRGDEKIVAVKLASIAAKVTRDNYMIKLQKRYPMYNLARHKGYGTMIHFSSIGKYGPKKIHRLTYLKN